ncbi:MAG: acyltransferase [Desulfobacteraceae bacterium]|nr:acyltransferase [Desulfobacteraceae bacterium]
MIKNFTHYELDATQLDQALNILKREQQANMPSRWQRVSYVLLSICVYGFAAALFFLIIFLFTDGLLREALLILAVVLGAISFFSMLIVLPLNVPLLRKLRYQIRLVRSLGLSQFFKARWKAERRKRRLRNIMVLLVVLSELSVVAFQLIVIVVAFVLWAFDEGWFEFLKLLLITLPYIIICLAFILFLLMRRYKRRLEVVGQLHSSLTGYKHAAEIDESTRIDIPTEEYEQIAQIEITQILDEREKNILASLKEPKFSYYSVQKSRSLREALNQLDPTTRLAVEDQIDELMGDPEPKGVTSDPKTNIYRLRVPETRVEIAFTVDFDEHRVKILSLQLVADDATSSSESGGQENA